MRQNIFFKKIQNIFPPWSTDPILNKYKFTNTYRASDRVSQYLISNVIYDGDQSISETFFRIILFKTFNKIDTWEHLKKELGGISYNTYSFKRYCSIINSVLHKKKPIYSSAYIMTSGKSAFGYPKKYKNHLKLIELLMKKNIPEIINELKNMKEVFMLLRSFPTIGDFLAYQYTIDINYSNITNFTEMDFVVPGPGARDGIKKCFSDLGGLSEVDIIKLVTDRQELEFNRVGLKFKDLWGRPLQLIDCQNLFCEVDKYSRVKHPEVIGISGRTKIKHKYKFNDKPVKYWYPPKWNINHRIDTSNTEENLI